MWGAPSNLSIALSAAAHSWKGNGNVDRLCVCSAQYHGGRARVSTAVRHRTSTSSTPITDHRLIPFQTYPLSPSPTLYPLCSVLSFSPRQDVCASLKVDARDDASPFTTITTITTIASIAAIAAVAEIVAKAVQRRRRSRTCAIGCWTVPWGASRRAPAAWSSAPCPIQSRSGPSPLFLPCPPCPPCCPVWCVRVVW